MKVSNNQQFVPIKALWGSAGRIVACVTVGCVLGLSSAKADLISGEIHFAGNFLPVDGLGSPATLGSATGLEFINPGGVIDATGDFSGYVTPWSSPAIFTSFNFNPLSPSPVSPLWTAGGFSFTLNSIQVTMQTDQQLALLGTGFISGNNFEDTTATWNFTGNAGSSRFTFSSSNPTVPDGGSTLVMLGMVLLAGFGCASFFRRSEMAGSF